MARQYSYFAPGFFSLSAGHRKQAKMSDYHSTYYGLIIWRHIGGGYRLRWSAGPFTADTLAGLKRLIRDAAQGGRR